MKHIFIVNPSAGTKDRFAEISGALSHFDDQIDYSVYRTACPKDATQYVRRLCQDHPGTVYRFYACGGDGTLNEVMQGVIGQPNASMTVYPSGSGNDFVKCMGGAKRFLDLRALIHAEDQMIDVMRVDGEYALNVVNFGFDTVVCDTMIQVKNKKVIGGKNAYSFGVLKAFFTGMKSFCHVTVDGVPINDDKMLLCTVANGQYVGGAFQCAPRSSYQDGYLDICLVNCLSRLKFVQLIDAYQHGRHLDDPRFQKHIEYRRGKKIDVTSSSPDFAYCLDGEIVHTNHFTIEVLPNVLRFAVPCAVEREEGSSSSEKDQKLAGVR